MKKLWLTLLLVCLPMAAQHITGSVSGTVSDPTGSPILCSVTLINTSTALRLTAKTNERGDFEFLSLVPGIYDVEVEASGFKRLKKTGLDLAANQRLATGPLTLELGTITETVSVSGRVEAVQTASAERSGTVTRNALENLQSMSRDPIEIIQLLPGFTTNGPGYSPIHAPQSMREFRVNGGRANNKNYTLDGISLTWENSNQSAAVSPNMDAVEQVQVALSNYQAEFGRTAGPAINIITKSGTQSFHGSGYFYIRNEALNANTFFNNRFGTPRQRYRYRTQGFTIGGPLYIPKLFNKDKQKLFFFFSESQQPASLPPPLHQLTMPTLLERQGNFSQTVTQAGALIPIRDPNTNAPFAGNIIPASRLNSFGVSLLKFFPEPNINDPNRRFNFQKVGIPYHTPRREEIVKVDYNISPRFTMYGRFGEDFNPIITDYISNYSASAVRLSRPGKNLALHTTQVLSPTLVNDITFGYNRLHNDITPEGSDEYAKMQKATYGITLGQFNKSSNPDGLMPNLRFGALTSGDLAPQITMAYGTQLQNQYSFVDNLSKIKGGHTLKFGVYYERSSNVIVSGTSIYSGTLDFSRDAVNPLDIGHPYANAAIGYFRQYQEVSVRRPITLAFRNLEWYAQDTWKVSRKFTLDYGMRFYYHPPEYETHGYMSNFDISKFNPAKAPRLYAPFRDPVQGIVARDPVSGTIVSRTLIGAIVPGSGDPSNGLVQAGKNGVSDSTLDNQGVLFAPRFGFAYDPTGKGDMAIRGGIGIVYDRLAGAIVQPLAENPPDVGTPSIYYGDLNTFLNSRGLDFPQNLNAMSKEGQLPTVVNFSLGVQRRISNLFALDVAYVGSLGRHAAEVYDYNTTPFGTNFIRANEDVTAPGRALRQTFLRPMIGFDAVNILQFSSNSNYHSLQTMIQRRFGRRFNMDFVWTWSKSMIFADGDRSTRSFLLGKWRDYGKGGVDQTHVISVYSTYQVPGLSQHMGGNKALGYVFDGWRLSGIARFSSGIPSGVALQAPGIDFTGSTELGRINVIADPVLPKDQRTFSKNFNTAAFAYPKPGVFGVTQAKDVDYGNSARDVFRLPGVNNWNLSLGKDFQVHEGQKVRLGVELFNAFNHTQYRSVNSTARFDAAGVNQINPQFGEFTGTNDPRVIQLWVRFEF